MYNELRSQNWYALSLAFILYFSSSFIFRANAPSFAVQYISKSFAELLLFRVHPEFAMLDEYDLASIQIHIFLPALIH